MSANASMADARAALLAEPCKCVWCHVCRGQGSIYIEDRMGLDMGDFEECWSCHGDGREEMCSRCEALESMDEP